MTPNAPADSGRRPLPEVLRVLVVDDCPSVRAGLSALLDLEPDLEVVGEAGDGAEGVELARRLGPDVVVMDVRMPLCDGVTATALITESCPGTRVLMLTLTDDPSTVSSAVLAGTSGYLLKDAGAAAVVDAVRAVLRGERPGLDGTAGRWAAT